MSLNTVPFNPFPPSSDQKGSGGGSYVLPAATAETLGGVKVGDNLTVEEDGTLNAADPYTLPIAADDTLGGVTVGSGLSIDSETGELSADRQIVDYSTTEQATGQKWIDGKDIYVKTLSIQSLPNNTTGNYPSGLTDENVIRFEVTAKSSGSTIQIPFVSTDNNYSIEASYDNNTHNFVILTKYDASAVSGYVTLFYTKTTP